MGKHFTAKQHGLLDKGWPPVFAATQEGPAETAVDAVIDANLERLEHELARQS
jgi:hypothetical protein